MDKNAEFLNYIYQNAEMGIEAIETLMKVIEDPQTSAHLKKQLEDYKTINVLAFKKLHEIGYVEKDASAMKKMMSYVSINMQTMMDNSPAHVAEMMMQGNTMGIIDITKNLKKYAAADKEIIELGNMLLKLEEDGFNQWKLYLSMSVA